MPPSPDGGVIADFVGPIDDPVQLATYLDGVPGVVEHGLFPPDLVSTIIIGRDGSTETIDMSPAELQIAEESARITEWRASHPAGRDRLVPTEQLGERPLLVLPGTSHSISSALLKPG